MPKFTDKRYPIQLWRDSLNNGDPQFHQFQQNEQSVLNSAHSRQKSITTYDVRNPGPGLGQTYTCGGFIAYFALSDIRTHNFTVDRHWL